MAWTGISTQRQVGGSVCMPICGRLSSAVLSVCSPRVQGVLIQLDDWRVAKVHGLKVILEYCYKSWGYSCYLISLPGWVGLLKGGYNTPTFLNHFHRTSYYRMPYYKQCRILLHSIPVFLPGTSCARLWTSSIYGPCAQASQFIVPWAIELSFAGDPSSNTTSVISSSFARWRIERSAQ